MREVRKNHKMEKTKEEWTREATGNRSSHGEAKELASLKSRRECQLEGKEKIGWKAL